MRKLFGFGSSTPPPPPPASRAETKSPLIGRWKEPKGTDTTEFHADGTVTEKPATGEKIRGRYSLDGSKLKIHLESVADPLAFSAVVKGSALEMTDPDGQTTHYVRVP